LIGDRLYELSLLKPTCLCCFSVRSVFLVAAVFDIPEYGLKTGIVKHRVENNYKKDLMQKRESIDNKKGLRVYPWSPFKIEKLK